MLSVALGADHAGWELKEALKAGSWTRGYQVLDFGTHGPDSVDYPDYAHAGRRGRDRRQGRARRPRLRHRHRHGHRRQQGSRHPRGPVRRRLHRADEPRAQRRQCAGAGRAADRARDRARDPPRLAGDRVRRRPPRPPRGQDRRDGARSIAAREAGAREPARAGRSRHRQGHPRRDRRASRATSS